MKKLIVVLVIVIAGFGSAMAQKGRLAIGGQGNYLTDTELFGASFKLQYNLTKDFRLEGTADNYFKSDGISMWGANANIQYLIPLASKLTLYPVAGLGFTSWSVDGAEDDTNKVSVNLGAGLEVGLTNNLALNFETKYQIIDNYNQVVVGVGLMYKF
jgi:outer membrane protein X